MVAFMMKRILINALSPALLISMLLLSQAVMAQQLPEFSIARNIDGNASSARFRGGVSKDNGLTLARVFKPEDSLDIMVEYQFEADHVGAIGNLYVVVSVAGEFFMLTDTGDYQPWNEDLETLQAATANKSLQATEALTILQNTKFGPLGLADSTLSIFLAYNIASNPDVLYYSPAPLSFSISSENSQYDPGVATGIATEQFDTTVNDADRMRDIAVLIYLPEQARPSPVVLFSHGLGGNRFGAGYLGEQWADRGYISVFLQHPGSDDVILDGVAPSDILAVMEEAASVENAIARINDVSVVLDQLELWNQDPGHLLYDRLNMELVGMSGHSFGARTSQAVSGQIVPTLGQQTRDPRIKAAVILSPSIPEFGINPTTFGEVSIPWLLMTGTEDVSVIGNTSVADRLAVYPLLPPGNKYELVLFEGQHHAFTDRAIGLLQTPRNPAHHGEIAKISTAFWDSALIGIAAARDWLEGSAVQSVLQPGDTWQFK